MSWADEDLTLVITAATELDSYLDSTQLNWPLTRSAGILTPGNLLLSMKRTASVKTNLSDPEFQDAKNTIEIIQKQRRSAWEKKIADEIPYRVRLWQNCIEDYLEDQIVDASIRTQIRSRVIIDLLIDEARTVDPRTIGKIENLDEAFKQIIQPGAFLWDESLVDIFPQSKYWYLYLKPGEVKP
jgi:hypothetical protein